MYVAYVRGSVFLWHVGDGPHRLSAGRGVKCNLRLPCFSVEFLFVCCLLQFSRSASVMLYCVVTDSMRAAQAPVFKLLVGHYKGVRPAGATRCIDGGKFGVRSPGPLPTPNFIPIGADVWGRCRCGGVNSQTENFTEFRNVNVPHRCIPCEILTNFSGFVGSSSLC